MEELWLDCPTCDEGPHEVLRAGQNMTVRCMECNVVRVESPPQERLITLKLVVSDHERSWPSMLETPLDELISVDDEFLHEDHRMKVTAVQIKDDRFVPKAVARDVKILQAIVFDRVLVKVTLNEGPTTRSLELDMQPEERIPVGAVFVANDIRFRVKTLKSDLNRTVRRGYLMAKNVVRIFADPAETPKSDSRSKRKP